MNWSRLLGATIAVMFVAGLAALYFWVGFGVIGALHLTHNNAIGVNIFYWTFGWIPEVVVGVVGFSVYGDD